MFWQSGGSKASRERSHDTSDMSPGVDERFRARGLIVVVVVVCIFATSVLAKSE
jgi:hypothetical protein